MGRWINREKTQTDGQMKENGRMVNETYIRRRDIDKWKNR